VLQEQLLKQVETKLKQENLPLAVRLWNGETITGSQSPSIELTLKSPSAVSLFLHPNLSRLAESYVRQEIDVRQTIATGQFFRGANLRRVVIVRCGRLAIR